MLRYFGAALLAGPGGVPWNAIGVLLFFLLGVLASPWWFIPLALQLLFTGALAAQPRFQQVIRAREAGRKIDAQPVTDEAKREQLASRLKRETRARYDIWARRGEQILERQQTGGADMMAIENNRAAIGHLLLTYLKLLTARQDLLSEDIEATRRRLQEEQAMLETELSRADLSEALRESKISTQNLLKQRLEKQESRRQALEEIESDLCRIEAHLDLSLEQAIGSAKPQTVSTDIHLATQMLDSEYSGAFGVMKDDPSAETTTSSTSEYSEHDRA